MTEGWRYSYIRKILKNRAVIGEYQPHMRRDGKRIPTGDPIPKYFPEIVKPKIFYAVQKLLEVNRGKGGRTGMVGSIF